MAAPKHIPKRFDYSKLRSAGYYGPQIKGPAGCSTSPGDLMTVEDECGTWTRTFMGVAADDVASGATPNIPIQVKVPFRTELIKVSSRIADRFEILDMTVGKDSVLPSKQYPIDCVTLTEVSQGACILFPTISPNNDGDVQVRNIDNDPADFRMTLFGWMLDN